MTAYNPHTEAPIQVIDNPHTDETSLREYIAEIFFDDIALADAIAIDWFSEPTWTGEAWEIEDVDYFLDK